MADQEKSQYEQALEDESICNICNVEMKIIHKQGKKHRYDKNHTMYKCSICGFQHRKRTQNELLRDLGYRDNLQDE